MEKWYFHVFVGLGRLVRSVSWGKDVPGRDTSDRPKKIAPKQCRAVRALDLCLAGKLIRSVLLSSAGATRWENWMPPGGGLLNWVIPPLVGIATCAPCPQLRSASRFKKQAKKATGSGWPLWNSGAPGALVARGGSEGDPHLTCRALAPFRRAHPPVSVVHRVFSHRSVARGVSTENLEIFRTENLEIFRMITDRKVSGWGKWGARPWHAGEPALLVESLLLVSRFLSFLLAPRRHHSYLLPLAFEEAAKRLQIPIPRWRLEQARMTQVI